MESEQQALALPFGNAGPLCVSLAPGTSMLGFAVKKWNGLNETRSISTGILSGRISATANSAKDGRTLTQANPQVAECESSLHRNTVISGSLHTSSDMARTDCGIDQKVLSYKVFLALRPRSDELVLMFASRSRNVLPRRPNP